MKIEDYFDATNGMGILSTADGDGNVNSAVYAKPHIIDGDRVAFIMRKRLTHKNLQENPKANYLFKAEGNGYEGIRIYLEKEGEETDSSLIESLQRRKRDSAEDKELGKKYLVYFRVKKILTLIGDRTPAVTM